MIIINIIVGIIFVILAIGYKAYYYKSDMKVIFGNPKKFIHENISTIVFYMGNAFGVSFLQQSGNISIFVSIEFLVLIYTLWLISEIDLKERIIPNQLILFLFVARLILLWISNLQMSDLVKFINYSPFLGFIIGGGILFISKILSKSGIGFGDVKMFAMIGFFVGENGIIDVLFYTFFLAALVGGLLLFTKKMTSKDTLPLAPFAFLSILIYFPITYINW